jgi:DNA-directed RNA polymerase specialized sigma24 family protein
MQAATNVAGPTDASHLDVHMASPSPSDLCWVIGFTPNGRWIAPAVRAAVGFELETARVIARTHLGDEQLALEIMELAIRRTAEYLSDLSPIEVEETRAILARFYRNEVRRRQRANGRLSFLGTSTDVEYLSPSNDSAFGFLEAELDLESILRDTPADIRRAMLLRYGARSQWSEVAEIMSKSSEAARKLCERRLRLIRKRLGL